ncbi:lipoprotein-anchoring transpeptidase ErfK/SrfK [Devosia sp. UYZn731]|uniref:L,D-transpeptidase family protein n=1 Tax=Devosia sp. UYZn731 TaxID=3156345 RepID=UPI003397E982
MIKFASFAVLSLSLCLVAGPVMAQSERPFIRIPIETAVPLTGDAVNAADLQAYVAERAMPVAAPVAPEVVDPTAVAEPVAPPKVVANPAIAKLQILLDQAGASPGVIDGFDGDNLVKAVAAFQIMAGLPVDGILTAEVVTRLDTRQAVIGAYTITPEDGSALTAPTPVDYAEKAQMAFLGYSSIAEELAERFHMDIDFLKALNPSAQFTAGETIAAVITGANRTGVVARIDADKTLRQVRAFDANGVMLAAYPATIGSEDNPSPSGTYTVVSVTPMPNYTYNPKINFQQGENTGVLTIPPGPNGPVGSMWIALSKPTFGIHGTPEPSLIDKTGSHGCIRLTNWDADELAGMVQAGVVVTFI